MTDQGCDRIQSALTALNEGMTAYVTHLRTCPGCSAGQTTDLEDAVHILYAAGHPAEAAAVQYAADHQAPADGTAAPARGTDYTRYPVYTDRDHDVHLDCTNCEITTYTDSSEPERVTPLTLANLIAHADEHEVAEHGANDRAARDDSPEAVRLTADVVLFGGRDADLHVLLVKRGQEPYEGCWALPGGRVNTGEDTEDAARRELCEETGQHVYDLTPIGVYTTPGRDPRGRYVSSAHLGRLPHMPTPTAGDDATEAKWMPVDEVPANPGQIAFDHAQIIADGLRIARTPAHTPTAPSEGEPAMSRQSREVEASRAALSPDALRRSIADLTILADEADAEGRPTTAQHLRAVATTAALALQPPQN